MILISVNKRKAWVKGSILNACLNGELGNLN